MGNDATAPRPQPGAVCLGAVSVVVSVIVIGTSLKHSSGVLFFPLEDQPQQSVSVLDTFTP